MCSLQQDGAKERAPCIDYEKKKATVFTSFGKITIMSSQDGLVIEGIPIDTQPSTYTSNEADQILSVLTNHRIAGKDIASLMHEYHSKFKISAKLFQFQEQCNCSGKDVFDKAQYWYGLDIRSLLNSIEARLYAGDTATGMLFIRQIVLQSGKSY
ncbi:MAG: hypothetical protein Q8P11_03560 [bacterium]|nr:hypothetical protein [bacterium]